MSAHWRLILAKFVVHLVDGLAYLYARILLVPLNGHNVFDQPRRFLANHLLTMTHGMQLADWLDLLRQQGSDIDALYWPRVLFMTGMSAINSVAARIEERLYGEVVAAVRIQPPVFILGHWRSGTTLLHNLLACDPQFAAPTLFQTLYPRAFLVLERPLRPFGVLAPRTRMIDNLHFGFDQPQEDEFALCNATLLSPYMTWIFPRSQNRFDRYLTLENVAPQEYMRWRTALVDFLRKVTWRRGRRLVLKSPAHTARIRLLLQLFPEAQFIHISRDPYTVFQSTKHLYQVMFRTTSLQRADGLDLDELILRRYEIVYDRFVVDRPMIPVGRYYELRFEELEANPIGALEQIYGELGLQDFEKARPHLMRYLVTIGGYQKNHFPPLPQALRRAISQRWGLSFDEWGYK